VSPLLLRPPTHRPPELRPGKARPPRAALPISLTNLSSQRSGIHEVDEGALAPDLDYRQPLAVVGFEVFVAVDLDLLEAVLAEFGDERRACALAEMAAASAVEDDARDRCPGSSSLRRPA
jgi:hypothetical protein